MERSLPNGRVYACIICFADALFLHLLYTTFAMASHLKHLKQLKQLKHLILCYS